jgi:hypothetical protein
MKSNLKILVLLGFLLTGLSIPILQTRSQEKLPALDISMQMRLPSEVEKGEFYISNEVHQWPNVNHFTGNSLVNEYIETYVCPTIVSTDFT